jgi:lipopolysaccharide biosynthesis protein
MLSTQEQIRLISFYLPQYHPITENNVWWGKGFTEWTNVTKSKPIFKGHYQPHLPADLGFYDLRLPEVRQAQANLAKAYGIYGFCYYHYWFNGKRLLERPFNDVLASGEPDFPFCLCWANENWTRRWDGMEQEVLMEQVYGEEDDRQHMRWLAQAFQDPRYIRVNGKPLFLVYRASKIADPLKMTEIWREEAQKLGIGELFLCKVESFYHEQQDPALTGFDAAVEFQPDWSRLGWPLQRGRKWQLARKLGLSEPAYVDNKIFEYSEIVEAMLAKPRSEYKRYPCVTPSWDNTARRKTDAIILRNANPETYEYWLKTVIQRSLADPSSDQIVFINAWNEWAEGNHLEPCQKWGHAYLEATRRACLESESKPLDLVIPLSYA